MKKTFVWLLPVIVFIWLGCAGKDNEQTQTEPAVKDEILQTEVQDTAPAQVQDSVDGYTLLKQRCYICHLERPVQGDTTVQMQAPPMMGVKRHYKEKYPAKDEFIAAVVDWVKHPDSTKALMPGAVEEFGLMPPFPYPDEELEKIAEAMYEDLPDPGPNHKCGGGRGMGRGRGHGRFRG